MTIGDAERGGDREVSAASTAEERLRELTERIRERARSLPAGAAIGPEPVPDSSDPADRSPAAKPGPATPPPPHWQEEAEERSQVVRAAQDDPGRGSNPL